MPIVALDLTDEEAARLDAVAEAEKRARKHQAHVLLIDGLKLAEIAIATSETTNTSAES